jgi:hypothetical protein
VFFGPFWFLVTLLAAVRMFLKTAFVTSQNNFDLSPPTKLFTKKSVYLLECPKCTIVFVVSSLPITHQRY